MAFRHGNFRRGGLAIDGFITDASCGSILEAAVARRILCGFRISSFAGDGPIFVIRIVGIRIESASDDRETPDAVEERLSDTAFDGGPLIRATGRRECR